MKQLSSPETNDECCVVKKETNAGNKVSSCTSPAGTGNEDEVQRNNGKITVTGITDRSPHTSCAGDMAVNVLKEKD